MNAWIGLGGNIGDGPTNIQAALQLIAAMENVELCRRSGCYRSDPWGRRDQARYTNSVAELDTAMAPLELLAALQEVENRLGRSRGSRRWGPRNIDIDILLTDDRILVREELVVPHPRMHRRAFVLIPLAELEPGLVIPGRGTVRACLGRLPEQGVHRLKVQDPDEAPRRN